MKIQIPKSVALLAILIALQTSPAMAGSSSVVVNGKSYHFNSTYEWNENNAGLGIEHKFDSNSAWLATLMANGFRDSTDNMSYMAGGGLHRRLYETDKLGRFYITAGLNAFVMTRKDVNDNRPFLGILPSISLGNETVGFNLTYMPKLALEDTLGMQVADPTLSGILFLQLKFNMNLFTP
jgi:hypothetical protein